MAIEVSPDLPILIPTRKHSPIWRPGGAQNMVVVASAHSLGGGGGGVPESNQHVPPSARQLPAIRTEAQVQHGPFVAFHGVRTPGHRPHIDHGQRVVGYLEGGLCGEVVERDVGGEGGGDLGPIQIKGELPRIHLPTIFTLTHQSVQSTLQLICC